MDRYILRELRYLVSDRADSLCEYCLIHENDTFLGCRVDHIISLKHGGQMNAENLAYARAFCNRNKVVVILTLFKHLPDYDIFVCNCTPKYGVKLDKSV